MSNCKGCGGCCSTLLPCSKNEIKTIRHYIKRHKIKPLQAKGLDCPFCDMSKKKQVHDISCTALDLPIVFLR